ncbi:MAG: PAS domain-containing protein [Desulfobacterales bacterium]
MLRIVVSDISERKKLEDQIQQSKRTLQTMIDLNSESVFLMEPNGTVIVANREVVLKMGRDIGQLIGHSIYEMLPEDIGRNRRRYVEEAVRTGKKVYFEDERDGRHYAHFLNPDVTDNGSVSQLSVLCVDITERRRMEDMLRQKAEQYHSFVETMKEGFIVLNKDMTVAYVNDEFCRLTRYEKKDLIGSSVLRYFDRKNQKTVTDAFKRQKNGEHTSWAAEAVRNDRSRIYLKFSPRPIFDADRNFQGSFAVITNITDEKQTEKGLKQQMERSRKQKENLAREVESYNHAMRVLLKDKEAEIRDIELSFVTNVRNALTPMLDRLKNTCLNDRQKQIVEVIESSVGSIVSPFIRRVKAEKWDFTPMELQIAHLIEEGKRNKEIADIFNISESAVGFHRSNIRQKLGLKNAKINLRTWLLRLRDK